MSKTPVEGCDACLICHCHWEVAIMETANLVVDLKGVILTSLAHWLLEVKQPGELEDFLPAHKFDPG